MRVDKPVYKQGQIEYNLKVRTGKKRTNIQQEGFAGRHRPNY